MTPLDYIRIDADVLGLNLSSTEKLILGAVKSLDGKGMMLSNDELARLLNSKPDTVSKAIGRLESKKLIHSENRQSRYRRIYFGKESEVESGTLRKKIRSKKDSTSEKNPATSDLIPATSDKIPNITKGTKGTEPNGEQKTEAELKILFNVARKLYPGQKDGLDVEFAAFKKAVKDWRDITPILEPAIQKYISYRAHLIETGQFCPNNKNFCRWLKKRCWETEYPDLMAGATRETTEAEFDRLLGTTADE